MRCKVCNSVYLNEINDLLKKGKSVRKVEQYLREKYDVRISYNSINLHRRNHLVSPIQEKDDVFQLLYKTGNYKLVNAIKRTMKIIKEYHKCMCSPFSDRTVKRKALVYICSTCRGWIEGNLGRNIQRDNRKKQKVETEKHERLGFVVRRKRRYNY